MSDFDSDYKQRLLRAVDTLFETSATQPQHLRRGGPLLAMIAVGVCLLAGAALAASGVFQTGVAVAPEVTPLAGTGVGAPIASSVRLLSLRVADPAGGPPWGLRTIKTTRGLMCVQVGRLVADRIGVLGRDGAFHDDGRFHPLSIDYLDSGSSNCATQDANGNAFLNEEAFGVPVDGLISGEGEVSSGCYRPRPSRNQCPPKDRRNLYYGLLGPKATSIAYEDADGTMQTMATAGTDGAYLVVLPHVASGCLRGSSECTGRRPEIVRSASGETGGPRLNAFGVVRIVTYRGGSSCRLPDEHEVEAREHAEETAFRQRLQGRYPAIYRRLREAEQHDAGARLSSREKGELESLQPRPVGYSPESPCPAVGYSPLPTAHVTTAEIATRVKVRIEPARFYCEQRGETQPCGPHAPPGFREIAMQPGRHETLVVIGFRTRVAITSYNRHYETSTTDTTNSRNPRCPGGAGGGGGFEPSDSDYKVGQEVRFSEFIARECHGVFHVKIGLVSTNGPSGATPVPGLPGQSTEVPVAQTTFRIP